MAKSSPTFSRRKTSEQTGESEACSDAESADVETNTTRSQLRFRPARWWCT